MKGALMVCGTASDVGKSVVVTGLCRWLARHGVSVSPFKAQNMALNSHVTLSGGEIGRAQAAQAMAAGIEPEVEMNPVLLKPTGERTSQVVVLGRPRGTTDALGYQSMKADLVGVIVGALHGLRDRFDVVVLEGAGSPAEINLAAGDVVNLGLAERCGIPAILVGDIDRGGVFASLYGTAALLESNRRDLLRGFIINKFRGDPALLVPGIEEIERRTNLAHIGTIPFVGGLGVDAEDSLSLDRVGDPRAFGVEVLPGRESVRTDILDVAVVRLPHISNVTDVDPLVCERSVAVRLVSDARLLGEPDLVVVPGTKCTVADLRWMHASGMEQAVLGAHRDGSVLLGICGGFQMLGRSIHDAVESVENRSRAVTVEAMGLLDVETVFEEAKATKRRSGRAGRWCVGSPEISGYEIHHGRTTVGDRCLPFAHVGTAGTSGTSGASGTSGTSGASGVSGASTGSSIPTSNDSIGETGTDEEGAVAVNRRAYGTNLHGLFEEDGFRRAFLFAVAEVRGKRYESSEVSFRAIRSAQFDRTADLVERHLDMSKIGDIIAEGAFS